MDIRKMTAALAGFGCLPDNSNCVHAQTHGEKVEPGKPPAFRRFCSLAFDKLGNLLSVYRLDPSFAHQPLEHLTRLWDPALKAVDVGDMTEAEALADELRKEEEALAAAKKKKEDDTLAATTRARLEETRKRRMDIERGVPTPG